MGEVPSARPETPTHILVITLKKFDWNSGLDVPYEPNTKAVEDFIQFMTGSRAWHDDLELVHKRVRRLKRDISLPNEPAAKKKKVAN